MDQIEKKVHLRSVAFVLLDNRNSVSEKQRAWASTAKNEPRIANKHRDIETQRIRGLNKEIERFTRDTNVFIFHIQAHRITNLRPMKINI